MSSKNEFISSVNAFFKARSKTIVSTTEGVVWQAGRDQGQRCIKLPIEVNGEQHGQQLVVNSYPNTDLLRFCILINFPPTICRLDYDEASGHTNSLEDYTEGTIVQIQGSHFHRWDSNCRFVESDVSLLKLRHAEPLPRMNSFDSAFRWFCKENGLTIPYNLQIDLPPKDRLL